MLRLRRSRVTSRTRPATGGGAGLSWPGGHSAPATDPTGGRGQAASVLHAVLLVGHGDLDRLTAQPHLSSHRAQGVLLLSLGAKPHEPVALAEAGLVQDDLQQSVSQADLLVFSLSLLHLCTSDCSVSRCEVSVEGEVINLRGEVAHPDGGVDLSRGQPSGVVIELKSYWWIGVWNDLQQHFPIRICTRSDLLSVRVTFPPILCMAMMAVWSESKLINPYPE